MPETRLRLALCGDVMTGRGIDQILPHPNPPELYEPLVRSAQRYVELAEQVSGEIARPVGFDYVWGELPALLARARPDIFIANLETSVTSHAQPAPKGINYRMHPANIPCLKAGGIDCCVLANNHVLDWGQEGLLETLASLRDAGIASAGAGADKAAASTPAVMDMGDGGRILVFAFGAASSGIPRRWAAGAERPGVNLLADYSRATVERIGAAVKEVKRPGDIAVASLHWGGNWGYAIEPDAQRFAQLLLAEAGFDLIHGHSSHHAKGIELSHGKLILHGCGDFLNDYEGISGYEAFRDDLALLYLADLDRASGTLLDLRVEPFRIRRLRLQSAAEDERLWLKDMLNREGARLGTSFDLDEDGALRLRRG